MNNKIIDFYIFSAPKFNSVQTLLRQYIVSKIIHLFIIMNHFFKEAFIFIVVNVGYEKRITY
jgi:hypothetical protein